MNSLAPCRRIVVITGCLLVSLMLIVVGCAPDADGEIISPGLGARLVLARSEGDIEIAPTPAPPKLAELTPDQVFAGVPDDVRQAIEGADVSAAETIALKYGCIGCHELDPNKPQLAGPYWYNIGDTAVLRVAGESPAQYLYESIINPTAYVVDGFLGNVMPPDFQTKMTPEEIADMVAFLLQQNGQP